MILIYGLYDSTIVIKSKFGEQKLHVGREQAERGLLIQSEETSLFVRYAGNVWDLMVIEKSGLDFDTILPPTLTSPSPRLVNGWETSNMSFVAKFKRLTEVKIANRNYLIRNT